MQIRKNNCLKIRTDNIFGPRIKDIKIHPVDTKIMYVVGRHIDYISGKNT